MSFMRWVRNTSEHYLMIDAQEKVSRKLGTNRPLPPRGIAIFWRRVYVPMFHRMPLSLRNAIIARMPGSHRKKWVKQLPGKGPDI